MRAEFVEYEAVGLTLRGYLATPNAAGPHAGVLVCHEGPGQDDHVRGRTERIASELGHVAFALDYHGAGRVITDFGEMMARLGELDADRTAVRALGRAGLDVLLSQPSVDATRVAALGDCFGGAAALELGRDGADLRAIVGFHASLTTPAPCPTGEMRARVLVCTGDDDPLVPTEQQRAFVDEMNTCGADWQLHIYGKVGHSFTNPAVGAFGIPGVAYNESADHRSWNAMCTLFAETLN